MFTMMDNKDHSARKRMLSNAYSKSYVLSSPTVREATKVLLYERLLPIYQKHALTDTPLEVLDLNYGYAMDGFVTYQFGLTLGTNFIQDAEKRRWYLHRFFDRRPKQFWSTNTPKLVKTMARLGINLVPQWVDTMTAELEAWNLDLCDRAERLLSAGVEKIAPGDFPVIYAQERQGMRKTYPEVVEKSLSQKGGMFDYPFRLRIASDMYDHNAAAHETSGDSLTYVHYELSRHPEWQQRLREELLTLNPPIVFPAASSEIQLPDPKQVDSLPVLDAVLTETLRRWMAVPGAQPRLTPEPSCSLAGYDNIPGNVRVQAYAYSIHRNPDVFPEPEEWKPERWLQASPEQLAEMRRWFWAFGSGGKMCIGNNIAIYSK
jgi:hypothetical protein